MLGPIKTNPNEKDRNFEDDVQEERRFQTQYDRYNTIRENLDEKIPQEKEESDAGEWS